MNKNIFAVTAFAFASALASSVCAQTLVEEVVIDREIIPVVRNSVRPSWVTPSLLTPTIKTRPLSFNEYVGAAELTRSITPLEPVQWADSVMRSPYRGYASLGYFPTFNLGAAAGYRFLQNSSQNAGIHFSYDGSSWSGYDQATDKYKSNNIAVGADATLVFRPGTLKADFNYAYSSSTMATYPGVYSRGTQALNSVGIDLAWKPSSVGVFGWDIAANFGYGGFSKNKTSVLADLFSDPYATQKSEFNPLKDITFGAKSDLKLNLSNGSAIELGIGLKFRHLNDFNILLPETFPTPESFPEADYFTATVAHSFDCRTLGIITFRPAYRFVAKNVSGRAGVRIDVNTGGLGKDTHVAPDIELRWAPSNRFSVDLTAVGREVLNSNAELWQRSPWMTGTFATERSHINADIRLALTFGSYKGFWSTVYGGWSSVSNWATPVTIDAVNTWALQENFNGFNYGIELGYAWRNLLTVVGHAEGASHGRYYRWQDNAAWAFDISAKVRPVDRLTVEAGYDVRIDRRAFVLFPLPGTGLNSYFGSVTDDLGNTSNLHLGATYEINDAFGVFLKAENILNHKHEIVSGILSPGIHGLLGVQLKF